MQKLSRYIWTFGFKYIYICNIQLNFGCHIYLLNDSLYWLPVAPCQKPWSFCGTNGSIRRSIVRITPLYSCDSGPTLFATCDAIISVDEFINRLVFSLPNYDSDLFSTKSKRKHFSGRSNRHCATNLSNPYTRIPLSVLYTDYLHKCNN